MSKDFIAWYANKIDAAYASYFEGGIVSLRTSNVADAQAFIKKVGLLKKELQLIKKEVAAAKRDEHAQFADARANIQKSSARSSIFGKKLGAAIKHNNANKRANLHQHELAEMHHFDHVTNFIDEKIIELDRAKLNVEQFIAQNKR